MSALVRVGAAPQPSKSKRYIKQVTFQIDAPLQKPPPWGGRGLTFIQNANSALFNASLITLTLLLIRFRSCRNPTFHTPALIELSDQWTHCPGFLKISGPAI